MNVGPAGKRSERSSTGFSKLPQSVPPEIDVRSDVGFHFARLDVSAEKLDVVVYEFHAGDAEPAVFDRVSLIRGVPIGPDIASPE